MRHGKARLLNSSNQTRGWRMRRFVKKLTHRWIRRNAKIDPEIGTMKIGGYC